VNTMNNSTQKLELDTTKDGVRKYWDHRSKVYPKYSADEEHTLWKQYLSNAIGPEPRKILDVGTGTGIIAMMLYELGYNVTGVDFSMDMMNAAKEKSKEIGADVRFMEGDVENLEFEDGSFDCVTARHVLWTMAHPEKAVKEWVRMVKPGGKIVIIDGYWATKGVLPKVSGGLTYLRLFFKFGGAYPHNYKKDINNNLPNPHGIKKEQITRYMSGAGVTDLSITDLKLLRETRRKHLPWYMKYSYNSPTYLVSGRIPEKKITEKRR